MLGPLSRILDLIGINGWEDGSLMDHTCLVASEGKMPHCNTVRRLRKSELTQSARACLFHQSR